MLHLNATQCTAICRQTPEWHYQVLHPTRVKTPDRAQTCTANANLLRLPVQGTDAGWHSGLLLCSALGGILGANRQNRRVAAEKERVSS